MAWRLAHRKTRRRHETPNDARFLTFSCVHRLPLFSNDKIKQAFVERLALTRAALGFKLLAWVIMPEHVHLMIFPDHGVAAMPRILTSLKRPFAEAVLARWRGLNAPILDRIWSDGRVRFWQPG